MVAFALLTIGAVLVAVGAGFRILKKEYSPLLRELDRSQPWEFHGEEILWGEEDAV